MKIGDIVEVEVIGMQDYGAFVKLIIPETADNSVKKSKTGEKVFDSSVKNLKNEKSSLSEENEEQKGLIHISEIQSGFIKSIHELVTIGQRMKAQIIDLDEYNGKVSLSIRSLEENPQIHHYYRKKHFTDTRDKIGFASLAKELPDWIVEGETYLAQHQKNN